MTKPPRPLVPEDVLYAHPDAVITVRKQHVADTDGRAFVLSDESVDRMGDIVLSAGWELRHFMANPIALVSHRPDFVIGTWGDLRIENKQLRGDLHLAPEDTSERVGEVVRLVRAGILKAVSVGFRPLQSRPRGKDLPGVIFERSELVECSLCAIPANRNSLAVAKSLQISDETRAIVFAKPGAVAVTTKRPPALPSAVEAKLETEREQLTRRLLHNVELLAMARETAAALVASGDCTDLPAVLNQARAHEAMVAAVSTVLGATERELFRAEQEATRLKRIRENVARSMKGRHK